ncbi:tyrosine-protein phosphatase [Kribbella sp. NPDC055071]
MTPLTWPNCSNVRDLGGMRTASGRPMRSGALIRSDNLDQLDDTGLAAVQAHGISRFIDLRSAWECAAFPSPFSTDHRWLNIPLTDPDDPDDPDLFKQYRILLDERSQRFAAAVGAIADAPAGPVVVNCHAGKDRTGLLIALVLDLLGVPVEDITADYAATVYEPAPDPETVRGILMHIHRRYGGSAAYVLQFGATPAQLTALRVRCMG